MRELSSAPQGHLFELLVPPGAERRGERPGMSRAGHRAGSMLWLGWLQETYRPPLPDAIADLTMMATHCRFAVFEAVAFFLRNRA
jgi:hypothetical protein